MFRKISAVLAVFTAALLMMGAASEQRRGSCTIIQTSYAQSGETFTVDLVMSNNPGVKSLTCNFRFTYSEIEFVEASDKGLISGYYCVPNGAMVQLVWSGTDGVDVSDNGVLSPLPVSATLARKTGR